MTHIRIIALRSVAAAAAVSVLTACSSTPSTTSPGAGSSGSSTSAALSGSINVFAAASLQETFGTIIKQFTAAHPGVTVTPNFGASSALATGITQGQPADVFASASQTNMDTVVKAGGAASSRAFATNVMEIAVPRANPANITGVNDLAKPGVKVAICQSQVPCGSTAAKVFTNAKITLTPVSQEADVKSVLTKVTLGEVDAGVVYVTDVKAAGAKVKGVEIPADVNASTSYPVATLTKSANPALADAFVAYVLSPDGEAVLKAGGFAAP
ncbi:MAG: molybdate ABC transporter substrate-binding protein [Actinomycetota bacterium]|nr:molybdate ABC transporter substrate-binding protein [Actinomycetota bacterium]